MLDYVVVIYGQDGWDVHGPVTREEAWTFAARWNVATNVSTGETPVPGRVAVVKWLDPDLPRVYRLTDMAEAVERLFDA